MTINTLIKLLKEIEEEYGDMEVQCQDPHPRAKHKDQRFVVRNFHVTRENPEEGQDRVILQTSP
mgnify:CR=1 FL=1